MCHSLCHPAHALSAGSSAFKILLLTLIFILFPLLAHALPEDAQQALHIKAHFSQFNYKTGISLYTGDVIIDQGSTHLTADRVITQNNSQHKIKKAVAYGDHQSVVYQTIPKNGDDLLQAKAEKIEFYPQQSLILLKGNAIIRQGKNSFNGPIIFYNTKDQVITVPAALGSNATLMIKPD